MNKNNKGYIMSYFDTTQEQEGKLLKGLSVSENKFQGVAHLNLLEDYGLLRPSVVEKAKKKDTRHDEVLKDSKEMHDLVQRRFDPARIRRAEQYSCYIENVEVNNIPGGTPAITLWYPDKLELTADGLLIPYKASLIAVDGETQTEARFMLRERIPETGKNKIAITIYHGVSEDHAKQLMYDYNAHRS